MDHLMGEQRAGGMGVGGVGTSQQRARMDHLMGEQRATRARGAEGGLFAETPAGLMMPRIMWTIITGRPAASAAWGWDIGKMGCDIWEEWVSERKNQKAEYPLILIMVHSSRRSCAHSSRGD